jgi:hypothetical protein
MTLRVHESPTGQGFGGRTQHPYAWLASQPSTRNFPIESTR